MKRKVCVVLSLPFAPLLAQTTWTVNSAGGAQFTAIQPAIQAAAAGDRVEVQGAGPYGSFVVDRGVEVESATGAICGTIEVVGVPAGQRARVSGFVVDQAASNRVLVDACTGNVVLANVAYTGSSPGPSGGLFVSGCSAVVVDHCDFRGASSSFGSAGASIQASHVAFVGGSLLGGSASSVPWNAGRAGLDVTDSQVTLRGVTVRGGDAPTNPLLSGFGGAAIGVWNGTALVLGQTQLRGGAGSNGGMAGAAAWGSVRFTADTVLVGAMAPSATVIPNRPVVVGPGGVLVGTTLQWSLSGDPGQPVWLGLDLAFGYVPLPQLDSALVLTAAAALQPAVILDAAGAGSLSLAIPNSALLRHLDVFAQGAAFLGVNNTLVLTAPSVTHTL